MAIELTLAQVQALAPDPSSVAAGRKLAKATAWKKLGRSIRSLWGECQGSALYQTQVALSDLAYKCSCPSRKFPCKHVLALLLLAAESSGAFGAEAAEPEWVSSWLVKRDAALEKKQSKALAAKPVDEAAQAKRAEKRQDKILAGLDQLDAWLSDLVRQGLARVAGESPSFWDLQARRLVDAQAPGLASRIRYVSQLVGAGEDWASRVLQELGLLTLLTHAYRRLPELDGPLAADVRRLVGFTLDQTEVVRAGDLVEDVWTVLADRIEEEERVNIQRAWLQGRDSQRIALVLQFSAPGGRFAEPLRRGTRLRARLAFWPSAAPQRALLLERLEPSTEAPAACPQGESIAVNLKRFAERLGRLPWLHRDLFVLEGVTPVNLEVPSAVETYAVVDAAGHVVPLRGAEHDLLLAVSGGHPMLLIGEWGGHALNALVAWCDGRGVDLARSYE